MNYDMNYDNNYDEINECENEEKDEYNNVKEKINENENKTDKVTDNVLYRLSLNPNKGGLQNVDKDKVNKIIYEVSKGSAFFKNAKEREKIHTERIKEMKKKYIELKKRTLDYEKQKIENLMKKMENERDLSQYIVHIDMSKSMISTANYEERKYGVRSAMPGYIALKLCKDLILVPPRHKKYHEVSLEIRKVISSYDPNYCPASVDEVFLNITNFLEKNPLYTPSKVTEEIRQKIFEKTKLTASAGIAPNLMLAKICSDMNKPNGQTELKNDANEVEKFVKLLPIGKVSGIGKVTERTLNELGIKTCGELKENMIYIRELFKPATYQFLLNVSLGIGKTIINNKWERKSISVERTFSNISDEQELYNKLLDISFKLAQDVEKENLKGKSVTLKLKTSGFEILTRCLTISKFIHKQEDIYKVGKKILDSCIEENPNQSYRLMGLRLSSFLDSKKNISLDKFVKIIDNKNTVDILAQKKEYECPVCYKVIRVDYLNEFEKHVNNCLNNVEDIKQSEFIENKKYNKKFKLNDKESDYKQIIKNDKIDNTTSEDYYHKGKQRLNNKSNNQIKHDVSSTSSKLICPICKSSIFCSTNEELNRHIDICLNNDIIKNYET
ncbi:DNA/RNA polymerase [Anaeromyces robustus]|uniref:DNA polymerase kappa n=1 Tax=Anaeromyces robustus TaxID=1754192 RepID=A0A1Y1XMB9_9FUNG|nr:DNA/RNA polymerase [Anaeromyces robustus]|eukprot:ORX86899.1 DNA/RNA polymerase [Anaeromyces robustus]